MLALEEDLQIWADTDIEAGNAWESEIVAAIERADIALVLVSASFLTSSFVRREEIPRLLERRRAQGLRIIPLIVEPCPWSRVPWLRELQARPRGAQPLASRSRAKADTELAALASEVGALLQRNTLADSLSRRPDAGGDRAPRYLCYVAHERLQELFEQLQDDVLLRGTPDGPLADLSLGPPRGAAGDPRRARATVRRLAVVIDELHSKQRIGDLNALVRDRGRLTSEWYEVEAEFRVPSWDRTAAAIDLVASLDGFTLRLSCAKRNFTGLTREEGQYIPTSTSRFLFEGEVALPMQGLVRLAHVDLASRILLCAPLHLVLNPLAFDLGELGDVGL